LQFTNASPLPQHKWNREMYNETPMKRIQEELLHVSVLFWDSISSMIIHKFLLEDLYQTFTLLTWFISETSWFNIFKPMAQWYGAWWKHINCKQACLFTDSQQITYQEFCSLHWPRNNKENRKVIIKIK
jgi:hypothetical protein